MPARKPEPNWGTPVYQHRSRRKLRNPLYPERNDPTSVLRMRHQSSPLLAGTFARFVALFSRLMSRIRRPVLTSWLPLGIPKITPRPTPPCLSGMSAGPLRLGT